MTDASSPMKSVAARGYEAVERVAEGTFGVVYRARQGSVGREVAVKIIKPEWTGHPEFAARFEAEAQLVARLEHPHIVPLYDYWRDESGAYLAMRWMPGGSVGDALRRGPFRPQAALRIVEQVADALDAAHRRGVIHRDLKPGNVLLDREDNAYLTDFGIAKNLDAAQTITSTAAPGTPATMAPEQIRGEAADARTDVYALGLLAWELLAGEHPWQGEALHVLLDRQLRQPLPSLRDRVAWMPEAVDEVLGIATAKEREARYSSAGVFAAALRAALAGEEPAVAAEPAPAPVTRPAPDNPYKGLRAFQERDADDFFGRDDLVGEILDRLRRPFPDGRFVAVVGPSGSGKSSLVRAGVVPALRGGAILGSERWRLADLIPGSHPLEEIEAVLLRLADNPPASLLEVLEADERGLARAVKRVLPDDDEELVLVVDQFEELFTLVGDPEVRALVLDAIVEATADPRSRLRVIVTLRADFFDRPLGYARFGELLRRNLVTVVPMSASGLERAVVGPAARVGVEIEHSLVTRIVADVADQPGALPLLQYALTEMYDRRTSEVIGDSAYDEIGGVAGALTRRAEQIERGLEPGEQDAARQVFLRLVTLGEGTEDTRRRVKRSELEGLGGGVETVLERFGSFRLLSFDRDPVSLEPTVEIAHEALLRRWPRLKDWIEESRDDLRSHRRLAQMAAEWEGSERDPGYLLGGVRLAELDDWERRTDMSLARIELDYLEQSREAAAEARRREEERAARELSLERRARTRLRVLLVVMTVAAVVATGLGVFAVGESRDAQRQARLSRSRELAVAALDKIDEDPELAVLLAVEAVEVRAAAGEEVPAEAVDALHRSLASLRIVFRSDAVAAAFSGDGTVVALLGGGEITLADRDGVEFRTLTAPEGASSLALDASGSQIAVGTEEGAVVLIDVASGAESGAPEAFAEAHEGRIGRVAFAAGDALLVTSSDDGRVRLWDLGSGERLLSEAHSGDSVGAAVSAGGDRLVHGTGFAGVAVYELQRGVWLATDSDIGAGGTPAADVGAGGLWVAAGTESGTVAAVAGSGEPIIFSQAHAGAVTDVRFVPGGARVLLASAGADGVVRVWDVQGRRELFGLGGAGGPVSALSVSAERLAASGPWGTVAWDISAAGSREGVALAGAGPATSVAVSADGTRVFTADGSGHIWTPEGEQLAVLDHERASIGRVAAGGGTLATAGPASLVVWDLDGGRVAELFVLTGISGLETRSGAVAVGPDGGLVAGTRGGGTVEIWPAGGGEAAAVLEGHRSFVEAAAFSSDGSMLATGDDGGDVRLWDVATGIELIAFEAHRGGVSDVAFGAGGTLLVTGGADGTGAVWEIAGILDGSVVPRRLTGHLGAVLAVAVSGDGELVATGGEDARVRLWSVETGAQVLELAAQSGAVEGVAFTPDGRRLLAASSDGVTRTYLLDLEELVEVARARAARNLTDAECRRYLRGPCPE